jgi:hypothetical protein
MTIWAPILFEVQSITLGLMGKLNELIKSLKICYVHVL